MQGNRSGQNVPHWETLTDDELLEIELTTTAPLAFDKLVTTIPEGDEETFVESTYDFRRKAKEKSASHDKLTCCICHQPHLAGFVMRKGEFRYLIGHICGGNIHGENFEQYENDHISAQNRQTAHRRRLEIQAELNPFVEWAKRIEKSGIFHKYVRLRSTFEHRFPWIWKHAMQAVYFKYVPSDVHFPSTFFLKDHNLESEFKSALSETESIANSLEDRESFDEQTVHAVKQSVIMCIRRIDSAIRSLYNVEVLFQPSVLSGLCNFANEEDNGKRRKYSFGLMSLSCKSGRDTQSVKVPDDFKIPTLADLERFRMSINRI